MTILGNRICWHQSTVRPATLITLELGVGGPFWVRIRTGGRVTYEQPCETELRGRELFERVVSRHTAREPLS